jgi:hypothetical protein
MEWIFGAQGAYPIDFYHLCDYLGAASERCAEDPQAWYETQKMRMKTDDSAEVL